MATTLGQTSGTYGQVVLDVTSLVEHAVRRCGVSAAVISAEQQQSARENLFLILSNLATKGLSLWCVSRFTLEVQAGRFDYPLPVGTTDVLQLLYREATYTAATTVGAGVASVDMGASATLQADSVLVTPAAAGRYALTLESSPDGAAWTSRGTQTVVYDGAVAIGFDAATLVSAQYWRVRDTLDPTRAFTAAQFLSNMSDTAMAKLSRDDYAQLPNKSQIAQRPLQYWYDKQFYQPRVVLWPAPSSAAAFRVFTQRQVQDPGTFTDAVEVPQRWLDAVISLLAPRVCLELPNELVPPDRYDKLVAIAEKALRDAEDSEIDGAPIRLAPNLVPYTR